MIYLFVFILLVSIELLYFRIADRFNIIDRPNERSSHTQITLRGGGIIFYFGVLAYFIISGFGYPWFMLGLTLISCISFLDDIRPISQKTRLLFHLIAMLFMFYQWDIFVYPWWYIIIALIICTGIINAYNFMDGINGITGGYSFVILIFFGYINHQVITFIEPAFIYIVFLAVLVFNFFNFRTKAKCFAGDVGSVGIAFILVFLLGKLILITGDLSYILLLSVYGVDSTLTILHRIILRENIGLPHRKHVYQLMSNELKVPQVITSFFYMLLQSVIMVGFFVYFEYRYIYCLCVLISLCASYCLFIKKYFHLHKMIALLND